MKEARPVWHVAAMCFESVAVGYATLKGSPGNAFVSVESYQRIGIGPTMNGEARR